MLGIKVTSAAPRINHLLFADDTMFFISSNERSFSELAKILKDYEAASRQKINAEKSSITFSAKADVDLRIRVKNQLGISKERGKGKY